jgi:glycosyltransferase involved in cell wall biosynthesis
VHTSQFGLHFPPWAARVGRLLEGPVARVVYRRQTSVAVSASTVTAMRTRLRWKGDIQIIPNGSVVPAVSPALASPVADDHASLLRALVVTHPSPGGSAADVVRPVPVGPVADDQSTPLRLVWVGRLVAHKRPALILPIAERLGSAAVIDVIGRGPEEESLAADIAACGLSGTVRLRGFLPEAERDALVARAVLHLNTSQGEGWGLCVLEAAALGVPTVAYDVEGLRDAVRDGETGWLVRDSGSAGRGAGSAPGGARNQARIRAALKHEATRPFGQKLLISGLAETDRGRPGRAAERDRELIEDVVVRALKELADPVRRAEVAAACRDWAGQFSWDESAGRMSELIQAGLVHASLNRRPR